MPSEADRREAGIREAMQARQPEVLMPVGWHPATLIPGAASLSLVSGDWTISVPSFLARMSNSTARYAR